MGYSIERIIRILILLESGFYIGYGLAVCVHNPFVLLHLVKGEPFVLRSVETELAFIRSSIKRNLAECMVVGFCHSRRHGFFCYVLLRMFYNAQRFYAYFMPQKIEESILAFGLCIRKKPRTPSFVIL